MNMSFVKPRMLRDHSAVNKAENHVTYFGYFAPVFGQDG